jgi:hypothetical protein
MPFTLSHPAAVIPIFHLLRRHTVLSALVIGSVVPDVWNLAPSSLARSDTHSMTGVLWPNLPLGLAIYALFHLALKRPAAALAPVRVQRRLAPLLAGPAWPGFPLSKVVLSLLLGAATHVAWDSFTHAGGRLVEAFPLLQQRVFRGTGLSMPAYRFVQLASTIVGLVAVALWFRRWFVRARASEAVEDTSGLRIAAVSGTVGICFGFALHALLEPGSAPAWSGGFYPVLREATVAGLEGLLAGLLAWSVAWHAGVFVEKLRSPR